MINTTAIRDRFKEFDNTEILTTEYAVVTVDNYEIIGQIFLSEIRLLCDSHDELERKLKFAIEVIEGEIQGTECDFSHGNWCLTHSSKNPCDQELLKKALKQIRGSND